MNTFTASNGMTVERDHDDDVLINRGTGSTSLFMADGTALALREFFRAEEDERLGRWRWPDNPSIVVYCKAVGDGIHWSFDERTGISQMNTRAGCQNFEDAHALAARAYFEAHPEPKPWHDAKPGEVWVITTRNIADEVAARVALVNEVVIFEYVTSPTTHLSIRAEQIESGRRIWPEVAS